MKNLVISSLIIATFGLNGIPAVQAKSSERGDLIRDELDVAFRAGKTYHNSLSRALVSLEESLQERLKLGRYSPEKKKELTKAIQTVKSDLADLDFLLNKITEEQKGIRELDEYQESCQVEGPSLAKELKRLAGVAITQNTTQNTTGKVEKIWDRDGYRTLNQSKRATISSAEVTEPYRPGETLINNLVTDKNMTVYIKMNKVEAIRSDISDTLNGIQIGIRGIEDAFLEFHRSDSTSKMNFTAEDVEYVAVKNLDLARSIQRVTALQQPLRENALSKEIDSALVSLKAYAADVSNLQDACIQAAKKIVAIQTDAKEIADQAYPVSEKKDSNTGAQPAKLK